MIDKSEIPTSEMENTDLYLFHSKKEKDMEQGNVCVWERDLRVREEIRRDIINKSLWKLQNFSGALR